jgi:SAM-dependent methyltransferase
MLARQHLRTSRSALDMDTGGGELLSSLAPFPPQMWAIESYPPNVPIAQARLELLGIHVSRYEQTSSLAFQDGQFDLVLNRHGSYTVAELARILTPGGTLLTQQVGGTNCMHLNELLVDNLVHPYAFWTLDYARDQLVDAGFKIVQAREEYPAQIFMDIGAVVYYLKAIPWQVGDFTTHRYMNRLAQIDALIRREGPLVVPLNRFFIEANSPF